jgi:hypothetical protein
MRVAAHLFMQLGAWDSAVKVCERIARLRPELPHSFRDLALALEYRAEAVAAADPEQARQDSIRAVQLLHQAVFKPWGDVSDALLDEYVFDERFQELGRIALVDLNRALARLTKPVAPGMLQELTPGFEKPVEADLRVVMSWDDEFADIDLHVVEPSGEKVYYNSSVSQSGGFLSDDCMDGLGPESYTIVSAPPGSYRILTDFFDSSTPELLGPVTVHLTITTNLGRDTERRIIQNVRLEDSEETIEVATVTID